MKKWSKLSKLKLIYGLKIFLLICFEYISYFFHFSSAIAALIELSINLIVLILIINLCLKFIHAVALGLEKKKKNKIEENSVIAKDVLKPGIEFTLNYIRSQEARQRLFNLMSEKHNLTLLNSELVDIIFSLSVYIP